MKVIALHWHVGTLFKENYSHGYGRWDAPVCAHKKKAGHMSSHSNDTVHLGPGMAAKVTAMLALVNMARRSNVHTTTVDTKDQICTWVHMGQT